jgi:hypothetical protein
MRPELCLGSFNLNFHNRKLSLLLQLLSITEVCNGCANKVTYTSTSTFAYLSYILNPLVPAHNVCNPLYRSVALVEACSVNR